MGKREATRLLDYYGWSSRHNFTYNMLNEWSCMDEIDTLIKEADELIKEHTDVTPLYYQSQKEKIDELNNNYISYIRYIDDLYMDIYDVDHAFFTDIKNNAVEQLSNVKQNKYAVQEGELADKYGFDITLTDFIVGQRTYHGHGTYRLEITELQDFSEMLKTSYEELAEEAEISTTDYILKMFENGEYDHSKYHPVKDFISGLLDTATLGILPMVELMAGYDFITGEELSSQEATNKGIEAVMGLVAIALIPFTSGGSVGLKAVGKQILVESATGVVSYTIYEAGEAMDMPAGITFALSIAGGGLTYKALDGGIPHIGGDEVINAGHIGINQSVTKNSIDEVLEIILKEGKYYDNISEFKNLSIDEQIEIFSKMNSEEIYNIVKNSNDSWVVNGYDLITTDNAKDFVKMYTNAAGETAFNLEWPKYGGYEPKTISSIDDLSGKIHVSRDGGDGGYTMGIGKNADGTYANNSQRAIPKSSAEVNTGVFDADLYKSTVDIVTGEGSDISKIGQLVDLGIDDDIAEDLLKDYKNWLTRPEIVGENNISDGIALTGHSIESKYGYYGEAAEWIVGDVKMIGGAGQMNTVYSWGTLKESGIISDIGKAEIY